ncbi:MAG: hypothetical protein ACT4PL_11980 [Phycisphaerales bacterium]
MPLSRPDIPLQTLHALAPTLALSSAIQPAAAPSAEIEQRWSRACAANPRLHDGPILAVRSANPTTGQLTLAPDTFKRLVVQDLTLDLGVRLLGVKGLLMARDRAGLPHILLARRGSQTRIYGGLLEIAPAGGVRLRADGTLSPTALVDALIEEAHEELALTLDPLSARAVAFVQDEHAHSVDVIIRADLGSTIDPAHPPRATDPAHTFEYTESRWAPLANAPTFAADPDLVPPARIVMHWLAQQTRA